MAATRSAGTADPDRLRRLIPLESLSDDAFERVAKELTLKRIEAGTTLFRQGKRNDYSLYLLDGRIDLVGTDGSDRVEAGDERARRPLVDARPHPYTGTAAGECIVGVIDSALLEKYLTWDQMAGRPLPGYELKEFEGTADVQWMLQMLQTEVFRRLPTGNVQTLFKRFEEMPVTAGQCVVKQGEPGDYYYIIRRGRCRVTRRGGADSSDVILAELRAGDAFGEEALLTDSPRNATVIVLEDGILMRLAGTDFRSLMTEPLVDRIDAARMTVMMRQGARVLDVRLESEFVHGSIEGARNLPLYLLRLKADTLDATHHYVVVCDTGARSAAAAFLLSERGLDVSLLDGGLAAVAYHAEPQA